MILSRSLPIYEAPSMCPSPCSTLKMGELWKEQIWRVKAETRCELRTGGMWEAYQLHTVQHSAHQRKRPERSKHWRTINGQEGLNAVGMEPVESFLNKYTSHENWKNKGDEWWERETENILENRESICGDCCSTSSTHLFSFFKLALLGVW